MEDELNIGSGNDGRRYFLVKKTLIIDGNPKMSAIFSLTNFFLIYGTQPIALVIPTINKL